MSTVVSFENLWCVVAALIGECGLPCLQCNRGGGDDGLSQPARFRSLYWIGWLIWAVLGTWLLVRLPESLPFVTWTHGEGVINVTWSLIVSWLVLFWAWPAVFRTTRAKDCMVRAGRGIAAGPRMLWAGHAP